ncbi:MAG: ATP synthase F1 subunit epsilon [Candidatus Moranbacteria bacterium]|nr:ATP synthase F1 subunit epsilon [Candidatus Moranbacteria bacterium]
MSELSIKLKIVTPEKTVFEDTVSQATLSTTDGQITILPNHRSYIASLRPDELMFKKESKETILYISGGFIEFNRNELVVLADTAERVEEIDLKNAEEARARAEELKKEKILMSDEEYAAVAAAIERESARVRIARKHYSKRGVSLGE